MRPTGQGLDIARFGVATACMKFLLKYYLKIARKKLVKTLEELPGFAFKIETALYNIIYHRPFQLYSISWKLLLLSFQKMFRFSLLHFGDFCQNFYQLIKVTKGSGYS